MSPIAKCVCVCACVCVCVCVCVQHACTRLRRRVNILHAHDKIKAKSAILSSIHHGTLSAVSYSRTRRLQVSRSLLFSMSWALSAATSPSSSVLYLSSLPYWLISLLCEANKNWDVSRRQTTMETPYSFQKPTLDAWNCPLKALWNDTAWKINTKNYWKSKKRLCMRLRSGDKHYLRISADRKAQISQRPVRGTNAVLIWGLQ